MWDLKDLGGDARRERWVGRREWRGAEGRRNDGALGCERAMGLLYPRRQGWRPCIVGGMRRTIQFLGGALAFWFCQAAAADAVPGKQDGMVTRVFEAPPQLVRVATTESGYVDPFAPPDTAPPRVGTSDTKLPLIKTARDFLEAQGIVFAKGGGVSFDPFANTVTVTSTAAEMDLVEAAFSHYSDQRASSLVAFITIVEGPGETIRRVLSPASSKTNASKELAELMEEAKRDGARVRVAGEGYLEVPSGIRATTQSVREHRFPVSFEMDEKGHLAASQETQMTGLNLEMEPSMEGDNKSTHITWSLELNPALPSAIQAQASIPTTGNVAGFPLARVPVIRSRASLSMQSGDTRLLGIAAPYGKVAAAKQDVLWASFLTMHRVRAKSPRLAMAATPADAIRAAPGLKAVAFKVPAGLFEGILRDAALTLQRFLEANGVEPVAGAQASIHKNVLTAANTAENIERIAALIHHLVLQQPQAVALTLHTVKGSGAYLRDLMTKAAPQTDHGDAWAEIQQALAAGQHDLTHVECARAEAKPGGRATLRSVQEHSFLGSYGPYEDAPAGPGFEKREVGSILEFDVQVDDSDEIMQVTLAHERHLLPPATTRLDMTDPASKQQSSIPITDFHPQKTVTSLYLANGGTRLISLSRPGGINDQDQVFATFVRCDVIPQVSEKPALEAIEVKPTRPPLKPGREQYTRSFRVTPDFLSPWEMKNGSTEPPKRKTAKQLMEERGITFPDGASVSSGGATSQIVVRNTQENLDKVEALIEAIHEKARRPNVSLTMQVFEAPGGLLRQIVAGLGNRCDHRTELEQLLKAVTRGEARHLATSLIGTKLDVRATADQGTEHDVVSEVNQDAKGQSGSISTERRLVGFHIAMEPKQRGDELRIADVAMESEFHTSPPLEHREEVVDGEGRRLEFPLTDFQVMRLETETVMPDGAARMLGVWRPVGRGDEDVLQAAFVTCDVLRSGK